jgi:hypothetical protein
MTHQVSTWKMACPVKGSSRYSRDTRECSRILWDDILWVQRREATEGVTFLVEFLHDWVRDAASPAPRTPLRLTAHLVQRLHSYVGRTSRSGGYVELTEEESAALTRLPEWIMSVPLEAFRVVELGFNGAGEVCKVAFTLRAGDVWRAVGATPPRGRERFVLFVCVGADGGVKTLYMTPRFKGGASSGSVPR